MGSRPLQAVQGLDAARLRDALASALDGHGPALLPLPEDAPETVIRELVQAMRPQSLRTPQGVHSLPQITPQPVRDDTALVVATSGSTGSPKGVELSPRSLLGSTHASLRRIGIDPTAEPAAGQARPWLCVLPTNHIAGIQVLLRSLVSGTEVFQVPFAAAQVSAWAEAHRPHVSLVPTQLRRLMAAGVDLGWFDSILLGGAAAEQELVSTARAAGAQLHTTYGMSETCGGCVYSGVPLAGVEVELDTDGVIHLGGPVVCNRYRRDPELSAQRLSTHHGQRWLATSDVGRWDDQGRLHVEGRIDDVINSGGHKILPERVAQPLRSHPAVADAVVVGVPDPEWGQRVVAVVVPTDTERPPHLAELRDWVRDRLPGYAAPRELRVRARLPLLPSGKPDLATLRQG
ncbi:AMP-binding protein [Lipingzhangella sp. LS1_29]|uniref:AMP-binding protein n=1 Tax=Lipingzhangella rawalii TaxID=2055835 RepID=A0ABU2H2J3_9ACTN|nr:AMP-binding protein [Lipingzhangella rawalii]MDS1269207.1 AMP-binding protein [Lipingzhangella rawalii]